MMKGVRVPTRGRDRVRELAMVLPVAAAYVVLRDLKLIAEEPIWLYLLVLFGSYGISLLAGELLPKRGTAAQTWARTGVQIACATVALYLTGWGAMLAIGYVALVADGIRSAGSKAALPLLVWSLAGMATGQAAIQVGLAPTMVAPSKVHGVAVLAVLGLVPAVLLFAWTAGRREQSEETATLLLELAHTLAEPGQRGRPRMAA